MKTAFKNQVRSGFDPLVDVIASTRVHPNILTIIGLGFGVVAGFAAAGGRIREAGVWFLVSGIFDMLDGPVARKNDLTSTRGAFLDSVLDRYTEAAFLAGLLWYYTSPNGAPDASMALALFAVIVGSLLVSYTRARAEGLGETCTVGLMERPERMIILILGSLIGGSVFVGIMWVLAVLSNATAVHRLVHVYRKLDG